MKPYVFFDVAKGREQRREGGGSLSNREEALLAACLFAELRAFLILKAQSAPGSVTGPTTGAALLAALTVRCSRPLPAQPSCDPPSKQRALAVAPSLTTPQWA